MDEEQSSGDSPEPPATATSPLLVARLAALVEVIVCSDYPTQFALAQTLNAAGFSPLDANGRLSLGYIVTLSLVDTVLLIGLIVLFLRAHGERLSDVMLGMRPIAGEVRLGAQLTVAAVVLGVAVLIAIQALVPGLRNVAHNPLEDLMTGPRNTAIFAIVVVVAGGCARKSSARSCCTASTSGWAVEPWASSSAASRSARGIWSRATTPRSRPGSSASSGDSSTCAADPSSRRSSAIPASTCSRCCSISRSPDADHLSFGHLVIVDQLIHSKSFQTMTK